MRNDLPGIWRNLNHSGCLEEEKAEFKSGKYTASGEPLPVGQRRQIFTQEG